MTTEQEKARASLPGIVDYFRGIAADGGWHPLRKIEYDVAAAAVAVLFATDEWTALDFAELAACLNTIAGQAHADGSGWLDFQLRISYFFRVSGYASDWDTATGAFTFWPAAGA